MKQIVINNISTWYCITETGKCFNTKTNKYLTGQVGKGGYLSYTITLPDGSKKRCYAHRLVAVAHLPNPGDLPQVNHIDGNKLNNNVENLQWCTPEENQQHAVQKELRAFPHVFCFSPSGDLVAEYRSVEDAARAVGISSSVIRQEVLKDTKALTGGFFWSRERTLGETKNYKSNGRAKEVYQYDLNGKFINKYPSTGVAARALGMKKSSHIGECCRGKIKTYKGFIWRYAEDIV